MESFSARLSRLFILLGAGIWLGGFIMLGFGVAPVNFGIAEQWELQGENPVMPEQEVSYRTIGGELTGTSILRLNMIESLSLLLLLIGVALAWKAEVGSKSNRMIRTLLGVLILGTFYYYALHIGSRLTELRTTVPIDFSVTDDALKSAAHLEFDRLHATYTRVASVTMIFLLNLFVLTIFDHTPAPKARAETNEAAS